MLPFLFILPVLWVIAFKQGKDASAGQGNTSGRGRGPVRFLTGLGTPRRRSLTAADYLRHLNESAAAASVIDAIKPAAFRADMNALLASPDEVGHVVAVLRSPMDTLFLQKDLNVLGAEPPLPEDGRLGRDTVSAISAIQSRFGQPATGRLDPDTVAAIRYAVGCIYSQDRAFVV